MGFEMWIPVGLVFSIFGNTMFSMCLSVVVTCRIICEGPLSHIAGLEAELLLACDGTTAEERKVDFREEKYLELMEVTATTLMEECKHLIEGVLSCMILSGMLVSIFGLLIATRTDGAVFIGLIWLFFAGFFFVQAIRMQAMVGDRYGELVKHCNRFSFVQENSWWLTHFQSNDLACSLTWVLLAAPISQSTMVNCSVTTMVGVMFVVLPPFFEF